MKRNIKAVCRVSAVFIAAAIIFSLGAGGLSGVFRPSPEKEAEEATGSLREAKRDYAENGLKGVWISYLEYLDMDFSSREAFTRQIKERFGRCKELGLNTVIAHVRPFGDAFYRSDYFPFSHIITGTQGEDPGYDPLEIMVREAHRAGLRIEAWINPYRVKLANHPRRLSRDNPALKEGLTVKIGEDIYYNPALAETSDLVTAGVEEVVRKYRVDGIHFDDYFYPGTSPDIDSRQYRRSGTEKSLDRWRRDNVSRLVRRVYRAVKGINPDVTFGISPRGNNDNNYSLQYSDVKLWLSQPGYADYIMPQLYWGFNYLTGDGNDRFAFENILSEWASYDRDSSVRLYAGLAAYRIGDGDGGAGEKSAEEWNSGDNLSKMIERVKNTPGASGYCLYRYRNLYSEDEYRQLRRAETSAVAKVNRADRD